MLDTLIQPKNAAYTQVLWNAMTRHYADAQLCGALLLTRMPLLEVLLDVQADWQRRGHKADVDFYYNSNVTLYLPEGQGYSAMTQAIVVASTSLNQAQIPVKWEVNQNSHDGTLVHRAIVDLGHQLRGEWLMLKGTLTGTACIRIADGPPVTKSEQKYKFICPDDPGYEAVKAGLEAQDAN